MMKNSLFTVYIVTGCLLLIFVTQAYLVVDYFNSVRASLVRESDDIIQEVFQEDLNRRESLFYYSSGKDTIGYVPYDEVNEADAAVVVEVEGNGREPMTKQMDLVTNKYVSKVVPINLSRLDSITTSILQTRRIRSDFIVRYSTPDEIEETALPDKGIKHPFFSISSEPLYLNWDKTESLQLVLVNPFNRMVSRMGLMLLSSLLLSLICVIAFRFLLRTLARQKQLTAFKNEFLTNIAHELKRPAAAITFNLDCMGLDKKTGNEPYLSRATASVIEMNAVIQMIVALARSEEGLLVLNRQTLDLVQLLEGLKERFLNQSAKQVSISIHTDSEVQIYKGDADLLTQCFANLIDNAIKYAGDSVQIDIRINRQEDGIAISVQDNGYGISDDKLDSVFDKYTRINTTSGNAKGFGIGLNYVKTIVENHKGRVTVNSRVGEGSEFTVVLYSNAPRALPLI